MALPLLLRLSLILSLASLTASCVPRLDTLDIEFDARYVDQPIACGTVESRPALTDLRFYVHDIELRGADGDWRRLALTTDNPWQQSDLALIDIEDATSSCANGTPDVRSTIRGRVYPDAYRGIRFTLGVPFERNHEDPLAAAAPLDDAAMHWHWRSGYKFLRAGVATQDDGFWIHLGSTGCEGTVGNISRCLRPNRVRIELSEFVPGRDRIYVDLGELLRGTDLADGEAGDCSSGPSETACRAPFAALGLDFDGGTSSPEQRVFRPGS